MYDPSDPFGLRRLIGRSYNAMVPIDPEPPPFPTPTPGPSGPVQGGPHRGGADDEHTITGLQQAVKGIGGGGGTPSSRRVSTKIVGAKAGSPDYYGLGDLVYNVAFQRLWEGFNPGKLVDDPGFDFMDELTKNLSGPNSITRHQGQGPGWLWGYVDPTWLHGYDPGRSVTTIEEILGTPGSPSLSSLLSLAARLPEQLPIPAPSPPPLPIPEPEPVPSPWPAPPV